MELRAANRSQHRVPLDVCPYEHMIPVMARAATTADAFNAVAEPRRRQILDALAAGERPVGELAAVLRLAQPQVSKHLRVLREVGAVDVRDDGRRRLYRVNGQALKPIRDPVVDRLECLSVDAVEGPSPVVADRHSSRSTTGSRPTRPRGTSASPSSTWCSKTSSGRSRTMAATSSGSAKVTLPSDEQI